MWETIKNAILIDFKYIKNIKREKLITKSAENKH